MWNFEHFAIWAKSPALGELPESKQQKIARERFVLQHSYKSVFALRANIIYPLDLTDCAEAKRTKCCFCERERALQEQNVNTWTFCDCGLKKPALGELPVFRHKKIARERFELSTSRVWAVRSRQLSYLVISIYIIICSKKNYNTYVKNSLNYAFKQTILPLVLCSVCWINWGNWEVSTIKDIPSSSFISLVNPQVFL